MGSASSMCPRWGSGTFFMACRWIHPPRRRDQGQQLGCCRAQEPRWLQFNLLACQQAAQAEASTEPAIGRPALRRCHRSEVCSPGPRLGCQQRSAGRRGRGHRLGSSTDGAAHQIRGELTDQGLGSLLQRPAPGGSRGTTGGGVQPAASGHKRQRPQRIVHPFSRKACRQQGRRARSRP